MEKNKKTNEKEKKVSYSITDTKPVVKENKLFGDNSEFGQFLIIMLVIIAVVVMLWVIDFLRNNKDIDEQVAEPSIQYSQVIVGNMLDQKYDEYYVIAYEDDENKKDLIDYLMSLNIASGYYTLDLTDAHNLSSVGTESNFKSDSITEIKFKGTTLLKIKKGKIEKAYEGTDTIVEHLKSLKKTDK